MVGIRTAPQPDYEVLESDGSYEVRRYQRLLIATAHSQGSYRQVVKQMFPVLADYIFGKNKAKENIGMTAPVFIREQPEDFSPLSTAVGYSQPGAKVWEMSFILPPTFDIDSAPIPNDVHVEIQEQPIQLMASVRFRGKVDEDRIAKATVDLQNWLTNSSEYVVVGKPVYAGYDPPWTLPMLRRQEVLVPVAPR